MRVLMYGSSRFAGRTQLVEAISARPIDDVIVTDDGRLGRVVQDICRAQRREPAVKHPNPALAGRKQFDQFVNDLLFGIELVVVFTGKGDTQCLPLMLRASRNGIPFRRVMGVIISDEAAERERNASAVRREDAEWRETRRTWREGCEDTPPTVLADALMYRHHDILSSERQLEREMWTLNDGIDPHAQGVVTPIVHKTLRIGTTVLETWMGGQVRWERPASYVDPFADEDELVNIEDFTTEELQIIDDASMTGFGGKLSWRLRNHVPLSRELFEEMRRSVEELAATNPGWR